MLAVVILRVHHGDVDLTGWGFALIMLFVIIFVALVDHEMDRYKGEE